MNFNELDWNAFFSTNRESPIKISRNDISDFNYDYNQVVFSSSFRRLQHKTQVFPLERLDYVRSRLTHSMEVCAIAKSMTTLFFNSISFKKKNSKMYNYVNDAVDIVATVSLLHDIGNPPFGHHGEEAIRKYFLNQSYEGVIPNVPEYLDFINFDGNAQGFRIATKLQLVNHKIPANGLNLCSSVLASLIKNPKGSESPGTNKVGYFQQEKEIFYRVVEDCKLRRDNIIVRHPLSYIMEAADDIANCMADLEDAVKKRVIEFEELKVKLGEMLGYNSLAYRTMISSYKSGLKLNHPDPKSLAMKELRSIIQKKFVGTFTNGFVNNFDQFYNTNNYKDILSCLGPEDKATYNFFKSMAQKYIYTNIAILKKEIAGNEIINTLLSKLIKSSLSDDKEDYRTIDGKYYALISDNFKYCLPENPGPYSKIHLVIDYISGMTDTFAYDIYNEIK